MFEYEMQVRMRHTDAAGVTFFAEQFALVHEAYEAFLESRGLDLQQFLEGNSAHLPIVHAEADYRAPLKLGDRLLLQLTIERIGDSSFVLDCRIRRAEDGRLASKVSTVHVAVDPGSREKMDLPSALRAALEEISSYHE